MFVCPKLLALFKKALAVAVSGSKVQSPQASHSSTAMRLGFKFRRAQPLVVEVSASADWDLCRATLAKILKVAEERLELPPEVTAASPAKFELTAASPANFCNIITLNIAECGYNTKSYHSVTRFIRKWVGAHPQEEDAQPQKKKQRRKPEPATVTEPAAVPTVAAVAPEVVVPEAAVPEPAAVPAEAVMAAEVVVPEVVVPEATAVPNIFPTEADRLEFGRGNVSVYIPTWRRRRQQ